MCSSMIKVSDLLSLFYRAYHVYVVPNGNRKESIDSRMHWHENLKVPFFIIFTFTCQFFSFGFLIKYLIWLFSVLNNEEVLNVVIMS